MPDLFRNVVAGNSQCKRQAMSNGRASENKTLSLKWPTLIAGIMLLAPLLPEVDKS